MKAYRQRIDQPASSSFVFRVKSVPQFAFAWHFHPEVELTYVEKSHGKRYVGDVIEDYESGDLVLLGPELPHTWCSDPIEPRAERTHRAIVVQFRSNFLGADLFHSPELDGVRRLIERSARGLAFEGAARDEAALRLHRMKKLSGWAKLVELLHILEMLADCSTLRTLCGEEYLAAPPPASRKRVDRVFHYIHDNYTEKLSQPEVAAQAHLSPAAFSRFFKRTFGRTFVDYITELRLQHACRLLSATDDPISAIAFRSGFANLSGFNRHFLRVQGQNPRAYRAEQRP